MGCANSQLDLEKAIIPSFISEPVYPHLYFGTMCQDRDSPTATNKLWKSMSPQLITKRRVFSPCMISSGSLKLHMHKCIQLFPAPHTQCNNNNNDIVFKKQIKSGRVYLCLHLREDTFFLQGMYGGWNLRHLVTWLQKSGRRERWMLIHSYFSPF